MTTAYGICDQLHLPLAFGGTVLLLPFGAYNPESYRFMAKYKANLMFTGNYLMTTLPKDPRKTPDLSSLTGIFVGGNAISADVKKKFDSTLEKLGVTVKAAIGYGLTEMGGACILSTPDCEDGSIGYPLLGVKVKVFDKEENAFFDLADGPHIGELYLSSPSVSSGRIGDQVFFELEEIDGEKYYNTNDLVSVGVDGRLFYLGRTDKYFVNNEGVRFDAGLVETAVGSEPGIVVCGLAPEMNKVIHDTIPVLYVQTEDNNRDAIKVIHDALVGVFVHDDLITQSNLPSQVVVADELPFTAAGKVDTQEIVQGHVAGKRYKVKPVYHQGKLKDIQLVFVNNNAANLRAIGMPEELRPLKMLTDSNPFIQKMRSAAERWQAGGDQDAGSEDECVEDKEQNTDRGPLSGYARYKAYKNAALQKRLRLTAEYLQKLSDTFDSPAENTGGTGDEDSDENHTDEDTQMDPRTKKRQQRMKRGMDLMAKMFNASTEDSFYED